MARWVQVALAATVLLCVALHRLAASRAVTVDPKAVADVRDLLVRDRTAEALAGARALMSQAPGDPALVSLLAACLARAGDGAAAERLLVEGIAGHPATWRLRLQLALLHEGQGKTEAAADECRALRAAEPRAVEPRMLLGRLLVRLGRADEAVTEYRSLAAERRPTPSLLLATALALHAGGRTDEAKDAYRATLRLDPRNAMAAGRLAELLGRSMPLPPGLGSTGPTTGVTR